MEVSGGGNQQAGSLLYKHRHQIATKSTLVFPRWLGKNARMNTKLTTLSAIGLCGLVVAVVAMSCSTPSPAPSATPSAPRSSALSQANQPPGVFGPEVTATTQITQNDLTATAPLIPGDLYRPSNNVIDHAQAAKFAWLEFIALVSPNKPSPTRGQPGGSFSSVKGGSGSTYPLVWETYQHRSELFPANAQTGGVLPPQPWDQTPKYVYNPQPTVPSGVDYTLFNNLDEASQIFQNNLFFPVNGNPFEVLFEAKAGQLENQYVANNYPLPNPATLYNNAIELKAAWRPVASIDPSQLYRYHVANVITYGGTMENPVAQNAQYALIGLHIIHKTKNYPSFIFATFEQVDNYVNQVTNQPTGVYYQTLYPAPEPSVTPTPLPTPAGYQAGSYYFASDPNGFSAQGTTPTAASFTATTNPTRVFDVNNPLAWPNGQQYTAPNGKGFYPVPLVSTNGQQIKVTLPPTGNADVANVNQQVKSLISALGLGNEFVWQYYQLTGVQAIPTSDETTKDYYLANIVVESSQAGIQLFRGGLSPNPSFEPVPNIRNKLNVNDTATGNKYSMGGCMGCHGAAQSEGGDFSFLLSTGQSGFNVDTVQDNTLAEAVKNAKARRALIHSTGKFRY